MKENGNVKMSVFLLIIGIFVSVIGAGFTMLYSSINSLGKDMVEVRIDVGSIKAEINNLTKRVDEYKLKGGTSYEGLLNIISSK